MSKSFRRMVKFPLFDRLCSVAARRQTRALKGDSLGTVLGQQRPRAFEPGVKLSCLKSGHPARRLDPFVALATVSSAKRAAIALLPNHFFRMASRTSAPTPGE
jgi:hypothetical protein